MQVGFPGQRQGEIPCPLLFPGNTIFWAVYNSFMDFFIGIVIQGQHFNKACAVYLKRLGRQFNADFAKYTLSQIKDWFSHPDFLN
jgi:hypothetical protein